jgi:hypothetical protein
MIHDRLPWPLYFPECVRDSENTLSRNNSLFKFFHGSLVDHTTQVQKLTTHG